MTTSNTVTKTDLQNIINAIFPATTEDMTQAQIEAFINSLDYQKIGKPYESKDLLWTNPSPTAAFATQTIAVDTSYDAYEIEYIGYTTQSNVKSVIKVSGSESFLWHITSAAGTGDDGTASTLYFFKRHITVVATGLTFGKLYYNNQNSATATWGEYTANTGCVPYKIYGIKLIDGLMPIGDFQTDYIVEQGTSGIWTYRKWNSGVAECWGKTDIASYTYSANGGSKNVVETLPTGLFNVAPTSISANGNINGTARSLIGFTAIDSATSVQTYLINNYTANVTNTGVIFWQVKGTWK